MSTANSLIPSSGSGGGSPPSSNSARQELDNLLRRELRVSDPRDARAVAAALMERYKNSPRARAIQTEAQGLPFSTAPLVVAAVSATPSSSDGEWGQAVNDVERSLEELTTNSLLTSVLPELRGWAHAIRGLIEEGRDTVRLALDVNQRDKAFGIRRSLGDYARVARLVGAATPSVNMNYRKLAQGLDEVASVLLVKMGEVLANGSFNGGRFIMQAPFGELQARRDAVLHALRNLVGSTQQALGPNDWPRGIDAYGELYRSLEEQGQSDLRALLVENEISRMMDSLIQRAARGEADGLRALGSTAQMDLQRFRRMVIVAQGIVDPESPPLTAFLFALRLFADAFSASGGIRLLRVARPALLFYGLYGSQSGDGESRAADAILSDLITQRGLLAQELDCRAGCCDGDEQSFTRTIILDKLLYDLDRAIDLYSLGKDGFSLPERRASAYAFLINTINNDNVIKVPDSLLTVAKTLFPNLDELGNMEFANVRAGAIPEFQKVPNYKELANTFINTKIFPNDQKFSQRLAHYRRVDAYLKPIQRELVMQDAMEDQWERLLESMAPGCVGHAGLNQLRQKLQKAALSINSDPGLQDELQLPVNIETALDQLVNNTTTKGYGRSKSLDD